MRLRKERDRRSRRVRHFAAALALTCIAGCGGEEGERPSEDGDEATAIDSGATTAANTDSGGTGAPTDRDACLERPEGEYSDCTDDPLCGPGNFCIQGPPGMLPWEFGVCSRPCRNDCQCFAAPGGTAAPSCAGGSDTETGSCILRCDGGETCPPTMQCFADLGLCAYPDTTPTESGGDSTDSGDTGA